MLLLFILFLLYTVIISGRFAVNGKTDNGLAVNGSAVSGDVVCGLAVNGSAMRYSPLTPIKLFCVKFESKI